MAIYWTKPTESGLGDRLTDILYLSTYAKIHHSDLILTWETYGGHENPKTRQLDPHFRYIDSDLDNVLSHIIFPPHVKISKFHQINDVKLRKWIYTEPNISLVRSKYDTFEYAIGGTISTEDFWKSYLRNKISFVEYLYYYNQTRIQFKFCDTITSFLNTLTEKFCAFHIRRGDKVRNEVTDGTFITVNELDNLNKLTHKWLRYFVEEEKYEHYFICSDNDETKEEFVEYLRQKNKNVISLPTGLPKWQQTYYDIAIMTRSDLNIASNKFSAFSRFASLLGDKKWHTIYDLEDNNL